MCDEQRYKNKKYKLSGIQIHSTNEVKAKQKSVAIVKYPSVDECTFV